MNGLDSYRQTSVTTQSKSKLVVMLYDGAIRFLKQAIRDIEAKDYAGKGHNINKAIDIIYELNMTLDMEQGGDIADNLRSLYNFMSRHLGKANFNCDLNLIQEVIDILEELNSSWKAIAD